MSLQQKNRIKGFTLVEVMVAMAIGLFVMGGVIQLFTSMRASLNLQTEMAHVQEGGRLAMELLGKDVRNADFWGCTDISKVGSVIDTTHASYDPLLHGGPGTSGGLSGTNNITGDANIIDNTDVLVLRGASNSEGVNVLTHNIKAATIKVDDPGTIAKGDVVMLSNCSTADIFQVTNDPSSSLQQVNHNTGSSAPGNQATYNQGTGNCTNCFQVSYQDTGAFLLVPYTKIYSIRQGSAAANGNGEENSLWLHTASGACVNGCELIEGIEDMQILYGEDTNGNFSVNEYKTANLVTNMDNVLSLQISLLVRTEGTRANSPQTLSYYPAGDLSGTSTLIGTVVADTTDLRIRKVYTSTTTIRNRMQLD